jgi:hypothetical protein
VTPGRNGAKNSPRISRLHPELERQFLFPMGASSSMRLQPPRENAIDQRDVPILTHRIRDLDPEKFGEKVAEDEGNVKSGKK